MPARADSADALTDTDTHTDAETPAPHALDPWPREDTLVEFEWATRTHVGWVVDHEWRPSFNATDERYVYVDPLGDGTTRKVAPDDITVL
jgi:hypothetical protein